jgi:hypothetical protein
MGESRRCHDSGQNQEEREQFVEFHQNLRSHGEWVQLRLPYGQSVLVSAKPADSFNPDSRACDNSLPAFAHQFKRRPRQDVLREQEVPCPPHIAWRTEFRRARFSMRSLLRLCGWTERLTPNAKLSNLYLWFGSGVLITGPNYGTETEQSSWELCELDDSPGSDSKAFRFCPSGNPLKKTATSSCLHAEAYRATVNRRNISVVRHPCKYFVHP